MKKWLGIAILGLILSAVFRHPAQASTTQAGLDATPARATLSSASASTVLANAEMTLLTRSFTASKAHVSGYLVHNYSNLNGTFESIDELEQNGQNIEKEFALSNAKLYARDYGQERYVDIHGQWGSNSVVNIVLTSFQAAKGIANATASTVLVVSLDSTGTRLDQMRQQYAAIEQAVRKTGAIPEISACIEGKLGDRMSKSKVNTLVNAVLQSVQATRVEGFATSTLTSMSAYSPLESTFIMTNTKRMNLQVAVHADTYHHDTNVLVGTPIITTTY